MRDLCEECGGVGTEFSGVCHCGAEMEGHSLYDNYSAVEMTRPCEKCTTTKPTIIEPLPEALQDFTKMVSMIRQSVYDSSINAFEDEDFQHYVYEADMEAVYGEKYWAWRNGQRW